MSLPRLDARIAPVYALSTGGGCRWPDCVAFPAMTNCARHTIVFPFGAGHMGEGQYVMPKLLIISLCSTHPQRAYKMPFAFDLVH